jgi:hypothetical protein
MHPPAHIHSKPFQGDLNMRRTRLQPFTPHQQLKRLLMTGSCLLVFSLVCTASIAYSQRLIYGFETAAKDTFFQTYPTSGGLGTGTGFNTLTDVTTPNPLEGTHAMQYEWKVDANQSWGGFVQAMHLNALTSMTYLDLAAAETLRVWYNNIVPATAPGLMYMRFKLHEAGGQSQYWTNQSDHEDWYFQAPLGFYDATPGWKQLLIPLVDRGTINPDSTGFSLPGWSGTPNNSTLDLDKIIGWSIEVNTDVQGTLAAGTCVWDKLEALGTRLVPFIIFNGKDYPANIVNTWPWGQSSITVETGAGTTPKSNAIKWTQGDEYGNGWTGWGVDISPPFNLAGGWVKDSLKIKLKAESGVGPLRAQFESGADGKKGMVFTPIADNQWHSYSLALNEFVLQDNTTAFDSSAIIVFGLMAEASAVAGKVVYITDLWTGNPSIDVIPPDAPNNLAATGGGFVNLLTWDAVPNEPDVRYNAYLSEKAWTDIDDPTVEDLPPYNLPSTLATHLLRAPNTDQNITLYYGVVAKDAAGNVSNPTIMGTPVTTLAKGVPTFSLTPPAPFVADGDLKEWASITPFDLSVVTGTAHGVPNYPIADDNDLRVKAYVAVDAENLYVAFDVSDNVVAVDTSGTDYLQDCPDLFIGTYDWRGKHHGGLAGGSTPDYHLRFSKNRIWIDNGGVVLMRPGTNYAWIEKLLTSGYTVEAKIPWTVLAGALVSRNDKVFVPEEGMRIPMDFAINDRDDASSTGQREGIMGYSAISNDNSYTDMFYWTYTWIGNRWVTAVEQTSSVPSSYELSQNYPNPFNPTTQIRYSLEKPGLVSLKVYDVLGREVTTLVNTYQEAGSYTVTFNTAETGQSLSSGVYFYRLESGRFVANNRMLLLK